MEPAPTRPSRSAARPPLWAVWAACVAALANTHPSSLAGDGPAAPTATTTGDGDGGWNEDFYYDGGRGHARPATTATTGPATPTTYTTTFFKDNIMHYSCQRIRAGSAPAGRGVGGGDGARSARAAHRCSPCLRARGAAVLLPAQARTSLLGAGTSQHKPWSSLMRETRRHSPRCTFRPPRPVSPSAAGWPSAASPIQVRWWGAAGGLSSGGRGGGGSRATLTLRRSIPFMSTTSTSTASWALRLWPWRPWPNGASACAVQGPLVGRAPPCQPAASE
mmetsp:Transcript_21623/g.55632  ORF Transcript_21623/g.55632 Transcript_21623/m.55632 type:complete len:277 (+) Transcript_21623:130-960(+)